VSAAEWSVRRRGRIPRDTRVREENAASWRSRDVGGRRMALRGQEGLMAARCRARWREEGVDCGLTPTERRKGRSSPPGVVGVFQVVTLLAARGWSAVSGITLECSRRPGV
jgi:hypothetical protein